MADEQSKLKQDKKLEEEVKRMGDYGMHPLVSKIQQRFGVFNLVRNDRNQKQVDIEEILKQ